jgi:hypothetical protein
MGADSEDDKGANGEERLPEFEGRPDGLPKARSDDVAEERAREKGVADLQRGLGARAMDEEDGDAMRGQVSHARITSKRTQTGW